MKIRDLKNIDKAGLILLALLELLAGIFILISHDTFTIILCIIVGIIMIILGLFFGYFYFSQLPIQAAKSKDLAKGLILVILGCFLCFNNRFFIEAFPVLTLIYGIFLLIGGVIKLQWSIDLMRLKKGWILPFITTALTICFSLVIIFNPFTATKAIWIFIGVSHIVSAILDIAGIISDTHKKDKNIITVEYKEKE